MPNSQNYPEPLTSVNDVRPSRLTSQDLTLINDGEMTVVFGQTVKDNIEIYVYDDSGNIAGHIVLRPMDEEISITKRISETEQIDYLNIDLAKALDKANVIPGRYTMTTNFFRDEVGSENGYKMYLATISPSRTEVRLSLINPTSSQVKDLFEFTVPSVEPEFAQALIDQVFKQSLNFTDANSITLSLLESTLEQLSPGILTKIDTAGLSTSFYSFFNASLSIVREKTLDVIAENIQDFQIQDSELQSYLAEGIDRAFAEMIGSGQLDPHIKLV